MAILDSLLVKLGIDAGDLTGGADRAAGDVENSLRGIAAAAAGAAVGAAFVAGLNSALDASTANTRLANQLDLTAAEAERAGRVAGDVFAAGFGQDIGAVNDALGAMIQTVGGLGEATDAELQQMTKSALALADTFQFDVAESTAAAGQLIKAGLVKDGMAGLDLLAATAQKLPPAFREELPEVVKEYTEFFHQLGFTGPQMMGLLAEAAKNPAFELDKAADAIKEFSLRLAETDQVREPLKELGLDVAEIQRLVNTGQGTQAFDQVTQALKGVEDQTERTRLQAALFGGPGEDMGNSLLNLGASSAAARNGLADVAGTTKDITDAMAATPGQQFDAIMRQVSSTLGEAMAPALEAVSTLAREHPGLFKAIVVGLGALAVVLAIAAAAQWAMNLAMLANPVVWIVAGIALLIAGIIALATKTRFFQNIWSAMTSAVGAAWDWVKEKTLAIWNGIIGFLRNSWEKIKQTAMAAAVILKTTFFNAWDNIKSAVSSGIGRVVAFMRGLPGWIVRAVGNLGSLLYNAGRDVVTGLWNGIVSLGGWLASQIWGWIKSVIPDPIERFLGIASPSKLMAERGRDIAAGLAVGMADGQRLVARAAEDLAVRAVPDVATMPYRIGARPALPGGAPAAPGLRSMPAGGGPIVLELRSSGNRVDDMLLEILRKSIRVRGGNVQIVLGGP